MSGQYDDSRNCFNGISLRYSIYSTNKRRFFRKLIGNGDKMKLSILAAL